MSPIFVIENNIISENRNDGIYISSSLQGEIYNNSITNNLLRGLKLIGVNKTTLSYNVFTENGYQAIYLSSDSTNNTIIWNDFNSNHASGSNSQIYDDNTRKIVKAKDALNGFILEIVCNGTGNNVYSSPIPMKYISRLIPMPKCVTGTTRF